MPRVQIAVSSLALTVAIAFGFLVLLWFISQTVWVWVIVLVALILASAMKPLIDLVRRPALPPGGWHIPSGLAVIGVYLFLGLTVAVGVLVVGGLILDEAAGLAGVLPRIAGSPLAFVQELVRSLHLPPELVPSRGQITLELRQVGGVLLASAASAIPGFVAFIVEFFIVLTLAAFLVIESSRTLDFWVELFPAGRRDEVRDLTTRIGATMGAWVLSVAAQMILLGLLSGITAALLGLPGPALFGLMSALIALVPTLGQYIMVIPAVLLGLLQSPLVALEAGLAYAVIAQAELSILGPLIAERAVRISPIVVVIAIPIGVALYGGVGAILSVPVAAALQIFVQNVVLPWLHHLRGGSSAPEEGSDQGHGQRAA
ncbi:MAG: AI-2E family transporter [Chloroflexota bacterium]